MGLWEYWAQVAAETGDAQGEAVYASALNSHGDTDSEIRSLFWADRSMQDGKNISDSENAKMFANEAARIIPSIPAISPRKLDILGQACSEARLTKIPCQLPSGYLVLLRLDALGGSAQAAVLVAKYYASIHQVDQYLYWARIAAEDGSALADFFMAQSDPEIAFEPVRATFWAKQALAKSSDPVLTAKIKIFLSTHAG